MSNKKYEPFIPSETKLPEFTLRALLIGLILAVVLGAANAYLGLRAGMTIAATYPAAVIGLAVLRTIRGSILEENITRTVGTIGESVAAGAIFTIPAFYIAGIWNPFFTVSNYITASLIIIAGSILGIIFVALLRKVMVEDDELPFPESIAAAEIHKAGQKSTGGSKFLFGAIIMGGLIKLLGDLKLFIVYWEKFVLFFKQTITGTKFVGKGGILVGSPELSPAYIGVGYIIGPKLASINFSGGVIAWGLLVPMILYFMAPSLNLGDLANSLMAINPSLTPQQADTNALLITANQIARFIVKPLAIGGMLVSALFTLYNMRKSLTSGIIRSFNDVKKALKGQSVDIPRTEKDMGFIWIILGIVLVAILTYLITFYFFHTSSLIAFVAATVMIILAFFFAAISGYLCGVIGSSNNPVSGLTLTAIVVTALIMVILGVHGMAGVAAVLGVAAIVCVSASVAGEMLQDLKAGYILGGTPWKMQLGDILGVILSGLVMFGVLVLLNKGDIAQGNFEGYQGGFGSKNLPAPQAGLMALLSKGIVEGNMAWPLIISGILMGVGFILMQVKSPMLVCIGLYLPLQTTFAIFIGGILKGITDWIVKRKKFNESQKTTSENIGILLASGLIAGEALMGLVLAGFRGFNIFITKYFYFFKNPPIFISFIILAIITIVLIWLPINKAKDETEPA